MITKKKAVRRKTAKKRVAKRKASKKHVGGRPLEYQAAKYPEMAMRHCLLGAADTQLADLFQVSIDCINKWKQRYPRFLQAIKEGRDYADAEVAESMYHRALGYSHPEEKVFCQNGEVTKVATTKHYPPDTAAAIFWLKNRHRDKWRDKVEVGGDGGGPVRHLVRYEFVEADGNRSKPDDSR